MTSRSHRHSPLALAVLALLEEAPMHAYRMQQLIKERSKDDVVNVARSNSVYQTIERLQRADLLRVRETLRDQRRPERTVYEITEAGRATLQQWLDAMLSTPAREFPEFQAALAFLAVTTPQRALRHLETRSEALMGQLTEAETKVAAAYPELPRLLLLEEEYRIAMTRTELHWIRSLIEDLRSGALTWSEEILRPLMDGPGGQ